MSVSFSVLTVRLKIALFVFFLLLFVYKLINLLIDVIISDR
jgi:hypothetical protein